MKTVLFLFISTLLFSQTYYSKIEPNEIRTISSNVSGLVTYANEFNLGEILSKKPYIMIDKELEEKELQTTKTKLKYLEETLKISQDVLVNLSKTLQRKEKNYNAIKSMSIKSQLEKDREFYNFITTKNQYLNTKKEIISLQTQQSDMLYKKSRLQKTIKEKSIINQNFILYTLLVKPGQFVNFGTPLAQVADISKAKLTIYLTKQDVINAKQKVIYINGQKTSYKISRVVTIADSKNISKYLAQIIIEAPKVFSNLVKVELKDD